MNFLSSIGSIILSLLVFSLLVVIHEFGHFIVAKKSGVWVQEFSVGMGPMLVSKKIGETLYSIRLLPIGGFCRMLGEEADDMDRSQRAFNAKSVPIRMAIMAAGPIMNFVLAFVLVFLLTGSSYIIYPVIEKVTAGSPAEEAGLMQGDRITEINGQNVYIYEDLQLIMAGNRGEEITVTIERNGEEITKAITPVQSAETGGYIMGFNPLLENGLFAEDIEGYQRAGIWDTLKTSFYTVIYFIKQIVIGLVRIFTMNVTSEEVSGPIGIVQVIGNTYEAGMQYSFLVAMQNVAYLAALLSANLGAMNLLPIPALDGGRLLFLIIEAIRRKPIPPEREGLITFAGFAVLMLLMVVVAFNDIVKLF